MTLTGYLECSSHWLKLEHVCVICFICLQESQIKAINPIKALLSCETCYCIYTLGLVEIRGQGLEKWSTFSILVFWLEIFLYFTLIFCCFTSFNICLSFLTPPLCNGSEWNLITLFKTEARVMAQCLCKNIDFGIKEAAAKLKICHHVQWEITYFFFVSLIYHFASKFINLTGSRPK